MNINDIFNSDQDLKGISACFTIWAAFGLITVVRSVFEQSFRRLMLFLKFSICIGLPLLIVTPFWGVPHDDSNSILTAIFMARFFGSAMAGVAYVISMIHTAFSDINEMPPGM
jgi:hypothetical protein